MDSLQKCILRCLHKINLDRTIAATYYILIGKKSSQTMQDIHLFELSPFFCLFPELTRKEYNHYLNELKKVDLIRFQDENHVLVTENGISILQTMNIPKVNGYKYGRIAPVFWKRLMLIIQSISNLNNQNNRFRPIVIDEDIQNFVKQYLLNVPFQVEQLNELLFQECYTFLQTRELIECEIFVRKLTGLDRIGLTDEQIATELAIDKWDVYVLFQSSIHHLLSRIEEFPMLQSIEPIIVKKLSDSTYKTKLLLQKNKTIDEISNIRRLKRSTVEDHIIEIMMNEPSIPLDSFVSIEKQKMIEDAYEKISSKKLKEIKQRLVEDISYFEIRLVLARLSV